MVFLTFVSTREPHNSGHLYPCIPRDMAATIPYKRESPFLARVWKHGLQALDFVSPASTNGDKTSGGDHSPRATKRRRITEDSLDSHAASSQTPLFPAPAEISERAFRIDVLRIGRRDARGSHLNGFVNCNGSPAKRDNPTIKALCRVSIFRYKPQLMLRILHAESQFCMVKLLRDPDDVCRTARIYLPQAFLIPEEKISIERENDQGFGLADNYLVYTELESAGDPNWPPRDLVRGQEGLEQCTTPPRQWGLGCRFNYNFKKSRMTNMVTIGLRKGKDDDFPTDLEMSVDLRWTAFNGAGETPRLPEDIARPVPGVNGNSNNENGALEPLTNGHVNGRVDNLTNGHARDDTDLIMYEDEEVVGEGEGEGDATTPSRSLRTRERPQTYNLKLLSDKARGKEGKERKKRKVGENGADGGQISWILPGSVRVTLENWSCIRCFSPHSSFEQLKMHLGAHPEFKYTFDPSKGGWRITLSRHGQVTPRSMRSSEVREPLSPDEHEDSDVGDDGPSQRATAESQPIIIPEPRPVKVKELKQTIPNNKQALFDRISKVEFEPGTTVDEPQIDNTWLVQKHRDIIRDYSDVCNEEKEYIYEWDAFAIREKVTFSPHLQDIYLDFLVEKSSWLSGSQSRITEAMKHLAYLKARDVLSEKTVTIALEIVRRARSQMQDDQPEPVKASSPRAEYRKSKSGCAVCGQPVSGPSTLICSNMDCDTPLHHTRCMKEKAKMPVEKRNWRCNQCYSHATT